MRKNEKFADTEKKGIFYSFTKLCLDNKFIVLSLFLLFISWGIYTAPFNWDIGIERSPVPVDAIPDIGENQQVVFTEWAGKSPQDIEDQTSYPLTVSLMGLPSVKTVRSISMFGFSSIYIIFEDDVDFYWSRSRIIEKLNSLPSGTLPEGVSPVLGPDSTALGQVFWYTLEGTAPDGKPAGGWDLHELRSIQDWDVRFALLSSKGVSEVASIGGFVKEYQIDVAPDAMRAYGVSLEEIYDAVRKSNIDVGARTIELNNAEYVIRGLGYIKSLEDIENSVIKAKGDIPVFIKNVAKVSLGPAQRRGILDKKGSPAVGGVVVVRYGENPLEVIKNVKKKIREISASLPKKTLTDGTVSQVRIVPFYDRTGLIYETLETLNSALIMEILITVIVILLMIRHFRTAMIISGLLPAAVLVCFIMMKIFRVDANIVALSGIAIAIGTIVDMGIVVCENILKRLNEARGNISVKEIVASASGEVGGAVLTAVTTTVISFLPVFSLQYAEGKLFRPLAFTKTFTLTASLILALTVIPVLTYLFIARKDKKELINKTLPWILVALSAILCFYNLLTGGIALVISVYFLNKRFISESVREIIAGYSYIPAAAFTAFILAEYWEPIGPEMGTFLNFIFVLFPIFILLGAYALFQHFYENILNLCLRFKVIFLILPVLIIITGLLCWLGFGKTFSWFPDSIKDSQLAKKMENAFPGLGREFMPALDEGSFLFMPSTMPHASIEEVQDVLEKQDLAIAAIPEVKSVTGKAGRAETALDPAPLSMIETVINYKQEYLSTTNGKHLKFKFNPNDSDFFRDASGIKLNAPDGLPYIVKGRFERDGNGNLLPDENGNVFRQWRPELAPALNPGRKYWKGIKSPDDIWDAVAKAGTLPGSTVASKLQPIETRILMLQSGMRSSMGVKVTGPDLQSIEQAAFRIEAELKKNKLIKADTVFANRVVGKPYIEIKADRKAIARYGIKLKDFQDILETAIGGKKVSTTVEGRERYPVRVRYMRELRDNIEALKKILLTSSSGVQIPLGQLADIKYRKGPQSITTEDTFLISYVFFDKKEGYAETDVAEAAQKHLDTAVKEGRLLIPAGVNYRFAGTYENQLRTNKRLMVIIPLSLVLIFIILYMQFKSVLTSIYVFSGIALAWAGGFIMLQLYGYEWFMNFSIFGINLREIFQISPVNLSTAVWVGFLALFGIATDDGVVMASYIKESFRDKDIKKVDDIRSKVIEAGKRRVRPCLMTTATTVLALIPILMSTGRGSDIMIPMAIPIFGGMVIEIITMLLVPVLYCMTEELRLKRNKQLESTLEDKVDTCGEVL